MIYSIVNKYNSKELDKLADLESKIKQVRLFGYLGQQGFHYYIKEIFKPITKTVTDSKQKTPEVIKQTTKAIEALD